MTISCELSRRYGLPLIQHVSSCIAIVVCRSRRIALRLAMLFRRSEQLYDVAFSGGLLTACVPAGKDAVGASRRFCAEAGLPVAQPDTVERVALTNSPQPSDRIVYSGNIDGQLTDRSGRPYEYAVAR
jgi:hypothetical protein